MEEQLNILIESLNNHSVAIKAALERIAVLETQLVELKKCITSNVVAQNQPDPMQQLQTTKAFQHLNSLGAFRGPAGIGI